MKTNTWSLDYNKYKMKVHIRVRKKSGTTVSQSNGVYDNSTYL